LFFLQICLLAWAASVWWGTRNNTLFGNGRWISGKDTGKYVFFSYDFLSASLLNSQVNLSDHMGFQEILYRKPDGPDRRLTRLQADIFLSQGTYLWLEVRKRNMRMLGCRLSNRAGYPGGFYLFDEAGEVARRTPFSAGDSMVGDDWHLVDLQLSDGDWQLSLDGVPLGAVPESDFNDGHFGFKGSGNAIAPVLVRNIAMTFEDPGMPRRTWVEEEKFSARRHVRQVFKYGLLFSFVVLALRRARGIVVVRFLPEESRPRFQRFEDIALVLLLAALAIAPVRTSGLHIAVWFPLSECATLVLLALFCRKSDSHAVDLPGPAVWLYGGCVITVGIAAFSILGDSLGRVRPVVPTRMAAVHPDAFLVHPPAKRSAPPFTIAEPVTVTFGSPAFFDGLSYRDQEITADFVISTNSTLDIAFQQQSLLTHADPQGEEMPLQRRVLRLSTREGVPMGLAIGTRSRLAPFRKINGALRAGERNRVKIQTDDRGILVTLNGEETMIPGHKPLGFGETGFLVYDEPVRILRARIEATLSQAVRESLRPWLGILYSILPVILLWLFVRRSGIPFRNVAAMEWAALYPLTIYFVTALCLGSETMSFLGRDRLAWMDTLWITVAASHLALILMLRHSLRFAVILFNAVLILLFGFAALLVWDRLPEEHALRLKWTDEAVTPGELISKNTGREGAWYSSNRRIGSTTFVWKHRFGGEICPVPKPAGKVRIFVMGGSQAWGSGAASTREMFSELLEKNLLAKGLPVEVFNAGVNGAGIGRMADHYFHLVRDFDPDIIVADVGLNDSAALLHIKDTAGHIHELAAIFRDLIASCGRDGVNLILALEAIAGETPLSRNEALYLRLAGIARENGVPVVDPGDLVRGKEIDHFVWWDTAHYAPYGHNLFAEFLEPVVEKAVRERAK
jgi:lysophospholipase L1-like esterase